MIHLNMGIIWIGYGLAAWFVWSRHAQNGRVEQIDEH